MSTRCTYFPYHLLTFYNVFNFACQARSSDSICCSPSDQWICSSWSTAVGRVPQKEAFLWGGPPISCPSRDPVLPAQLTVPSPERLQTLQGILLLYWAPGWQVPLGQQVQVLGNWNCWGTKAQEWNYRDLEGSSLHYLWNYQNYADKAFLIDKYFN